MITILIDLHMETFTMRGILYENIIMLLVINSGWG